MPVARTPSAVEEFVIGEPLEVQKLIARAFRSADQLVELELKRVRVAVLRVLRQEGDEERDLTAA